MTDYYTQPSDSVLRTFVAESNRIEGIHRPPNQRELVAHATFLALGEIAVKNMERFVHDVAGQRLRRAKGANVRVGAHVPPLGGPWIERELRLLLADATAGNSPYDVHVAYEALHPFSDGNGRSGRALWAWMMLRQGRDPFELGFLHRWYYDSLNASRSEVER